MDDATLSQENHPVTQKEVEEALRLVRDGKLELLGALALARHPGVTGCRLAEEPDNNLVRGILLKGMLHWAIDKLHPNPGSCADELWFNPYDSRWLDKEWRPYHVLYHNHFGERTFAEVAEQIGVSSSTPFSIRRSALTEVGKLLQSSEQTAPLAECQRYANRARWTSLDPTARWLLMRAVCYRYPLSPELLQEWLEGVVVSRDLFPGLQERGLLQCLSNNIYVIHPVFRTYLLSLSELPETWSEPPRWAPEDKARKDESQWEAERERAKQLALTAQQKERERAVAYHTAQQAILEAAYNLYHLKRTPGGLTGATRAATLLIEQQEAVVGRYAWQEIKEVIDLFKGVPLARFHWFQLKLLEGDATLAAEKVQQALDAYDEVHNACRLPQDIEICIVAAHRLGKAFRRFAPEGAQEYYQECSRLLRQIEAPSPLLVPIFVDQAWSLIQERKDLAEAERLLTLAQQFMEQQGKDKALEAKLHNAWAGFYVHRKQPNKVIEHRWQAYLAIKRAQDREFEARIAKNLGFDYAQLQGRYDVAFHFLERALTLSVQVGERQLEGLCLKDLGNCCFWQGDYSEAIARYEAAYAIFEEGNNKNWLAAVCLDLTEAHAELHDGKNARCYFKQGRALAEELGHADYLAFVGYLQRRYPNLCALDLALTARQVWMLDYVAQHGSITSSAFEKTYHRSPKTAQRALNDLCEKRLFIKVGEGPARRYRFSPPPARGYRTVFPRLPFSLSCLLPSPAARVSTNRTPTLPIEGSPVWVSTVGVLRWPSSWAETDTAQSV